MITAIDHVQLAAPTGCEAAARAFFGELLGLEEIEKPEALRERGGVWFRVGAQQLHVGVDTDFAPALKAHRGSRSPDTTSCRWTRSLLVELGHDPADGLRVL